MGMQANSYLTKIMVIATFGGLLFGYDTGVVNGALSYMAQPDQLNLTPLREGMVTSALLLGGAVGAMLGGTLSDKYGRRKMIFCLSILFFISTLGCSLTPNFEFMVVSRLALGLAVGGASGIVPAYLAEVAPMEKRGRIVTQNELMICVGVSLAFIFNALISIAMDGNSHVWRYMLAVAAVPAVVLFVGMMRLPESPRWLVSKGKVTEALEVLKKIRHSEALEVLKKIRHSEARAIAELNEIQDIVAAQLSQKPVSLKDLNTPWIRRCILIGMGIGITTQVTGVNSLMYYGTHVLVESGLSLQAALIANTMNGITSIGGTVLGIWLLTKINRRTMMLAGFCGTTSALFLISMAAMLFESLSIFPFIILGLLVIFLMFMQSCIGPLLWLLLSEIIPLRVRGIGLGACILVYWLTNFTIGLLFPVLLSAFGLQMTFMIFVAMGICSIIFTLRFIPETRGKSLEVIEEQFRNYDRKVIQSVIKNQLSD